MRNTAVRTAAGVALVLLVLMCHMQHAEAMIFKFTSSDPICFIEEVLTDTSAITGTYSWASTQQTSGVSMVIKVTDPSGIPVGLPLQMERGFHNIRVQLPGGHEAGRYALCAFVSNNPAKVNLVENPVMVEFMIDQSMVSTGKDDEAILAIRKRVQGKEVFTFTEHGGQQKDILQPAKYLEDVANGLRQLDREFDQMKRGVNAYFERQVRMRDTTEATFTRVWVCASFTILVIIVVVVVQFRMLKSTIKRKKLI